MSSSDDVVGGAPDRTAEVRALDPSVLARLASDAGREIAARFATRYAELLQVRVDRIVAAVDAGDVDSAMDTVLSLKVSSSTVGTAELVALAAALEADVAAHDWAHARDTCARLPGAAHRAEDALAGLRGS